MKNLLCFGDSLTAGYNNNGKNFFPYPMTLDDLLGEEYNVDYIGISGVNIDEVLNNLDNDISDITGICWYGLRKQLSRKNYSYLILLIGSNDLCDYNVKNVVNDIQKLTKIANSMNVKPVVLTIPKLVFEKEDIDMKDVREEINKTLINDANEYYEVIDIAKHIDMSDYETVYDSDGLHFSETGYKKIAEIIYNHMIRYPV